MTAPRWIERFEAAPAAPWWLHEGGTLSLVEEGAVDIFATTAGENGSAGARQPLFRVFADMSIMPVARTPALGAAALLAVPLPGTRLRSIPLDALEGLAAPGADRAQLTSLIASWIGVITRGQPLAPKDYRALRGAEPLCVGQGESFCAVDRMVWAKLARGRAAFMDDGGLEITPDTPALPLRNDVWCRALDDAEVTAVEQDALIDSGEFWSGVAAYQDLAIGHALRRAERQRNAELERLHVKADRASRVMHEALSRFVRVAHGTGEAAPEAADDRLLAACESIGRRLGITFQAPRASARAAPGRDRVQDIADASAVRTRSVALKGEWWTQDNGPLLAFDAETKAPYALLPLRDRRYELHDPATGEVRRVTPAIARSLGGFATQFYRSFPARPVGLADILRFGLRGLGGDLAVTIGLGLLGGLIGMAIPIATGWMMDRVIPAAQPGDALVLMAALIAAVTATQVFELVRAVAVLRIEGRMDGAVQSAVWDRVLALPTPFFRKYSAGDLATRINGVNTIRHALSGTTVSTLISGVFTAFNFLLLFHYSVTLAAVAAVLTLIAVAVVVATGLVRLRYERQLAELSGRLSGMVYQYLTGIVKLRVAAAENRAFANWARAFAQVRVLSLKAQNATVVSHTFFSGYAIVANAVVFAAVGLYLAQSGAAGAKPLSTGEFIAFSAAFGSFFGALVAVSAALLGLLNLAPIYARAKPILETVPEVDPAKKHPGDLEGAIEVVKVGFSYTADQEILKDVSFSVRPGGFIALVGPSGSGKSTLFRLLLGFEKPKRGAVYYDSQDLADLDVRAVRRQLGVVLQGGQLMSGDIFTNIVGTSGLTIDDAWEAARMVGLEEDVQAMPMGMHTIVSEGSSTLSGGQRQRILIARAIVHRPRIVFFDEATSALDNRTQAIVSRSLENLKATRIVIAHRLSTVVNADRIIVLQDGAIVQTGSYAELIGREGPFAELARRQIA